MLRVHVRLNLEDEAGELLLRRLDRAKGRFARRRCRCQLEEFPEERLDAEVRQCAAEEHRDQCTRENFIVIERVARRFQQLEIVEQLVMRLRAKQIDHLRTVQTALVSGGALCAVIVAPVEQIDLFLSSIIDTDEIAVAMNRPGDGMAVDPQIGLDVADQLERILADAIALVDKREDRHPPALADLEQLAGPIFDALALSRSIIALSAATSVRYVSSEKSS